MAFGLTSALNRPRLAPTAGIAPDYTLTSAGTVAAFDLIDAQRTPTVVSGLPAADLGNVTDSLAEDDPPAGTAPLGFPRVDPISQFDGGDFEGANCTLAAGAMLARLGFGIVTNGSILRTLQSDQVGGTDIHDLQRAIFHGYGVQFSTGSVTTRQLRRLLTAGYGAVIQGDYGEIPAQLRLQPSFTGGHAIYLDGFYPGSGGIPAAYYVIDPIGRGSSYRGGWWPASVVDAFGLAFGGGSRIPAAWVFPPGGAPPPLIVPPNVPPLPPDAGDGSPSVSPGASPGASPSGGAGEEPGTDPPPEPDPGPALDPGTLGGFDLVPFLTVCIVNPDLGGCPSGVEGIFELAPPLFTLPLAPAIDVRFVDSDRPNVALIGFTVSQPAPVDVRYWEADGTPATIEGPTTMATMDVGGEPMIVAGLDVAAGTTYHYQVVAGDGAFTSVSPIGTFTTGYGVRLFETALATVTSPTLALETGLSPFLHEADGALSPPLLVMVDGERPAECPGSVFGFGAESYCLADIDAVQARCQTVDVSYDLDGIGTSGVLIRAFPTTTGELRDGSPTLTGILEADGPAGAGEVTIGCLASGLTYSIVIDALGDDDGILAAHTIVVP